ncbi:hypothetical protein HDV05_001666 [Chytridiales sp. JEL 0842]|nr:hypothetical protein HDV05_001666 [Chytridiales sp. JEL 0842]
MSNTTTLFNTLERDVLGARLTKDGWFYVYDEQFVEIRSIKTCQLLAGFDAQESKMSEVKIIVEVVDAVIEGSRYLLVVMKNAAGMHSFSLFEPFSMSIQPLHSSQLTFLGAKITALQVSEACLDPTSNLKFHLMAVSKEEGRVEVFRLFPLMTMAARLEMTVVQQPAQYDWSMPEKVTNFQIIAPQLSSYAPLILYGTKDGKVGCLKLSENGIEIVGQEAGELSHGHVHFLKVDQSRQFDLHTILLVGRGGDSTPVSLSVYKVFLSGDEKIRLLHKKVLPNGAKSIQAVAMSQEEGSYQFVCAVSTLQSEQSRIIKLGCSDVSIYDMPNASGDVAPDTPIMDLARRGHSLEVVVLCQDRLTKFTGFMPPSTSINSGESSFPFDEWFSFDDNQVEVLFKQYAENVIKCRHILDGELFIDRILKQAGLSNPETIIPIRSPLDLRKLIYQLFTSALSSSEKYFITYYFIRSFSSNMVDDFCSKYLLSASSMVAIDCYWALDHGNAERACQSVADPSFGSDFSAKLINALCAYRRFADASLYIEAANPQCETEHDMKIRLQIMLRMGLPDAFLFQRKFSEDVSPKLFKQLLEYAFSEPLNHDNISTLLMLPYNLKEEDLFISFCQQEIASSFVKSCLILYYIQNGRFVEAIRHYETQKLLALSGNASVDSAIIMDESMECMMETLKRLLPAVQRHALEMELERALEPYQSAGPRPLLKPTAVPSFEQSQKNIIRTFLSNMQASVTENIVNNAIIEDNDVQMLDPQSTSVDIIPHTSTPLGVQALQASIKKPSSPFMMPPSTPKKETPPGTVPSSTSKPSPKQEVTMGSAKKAVFDDFVRPRDRAPSAQKRQEIPSPVPVFASPRTSSSPFGAPFGNISPFAKHTSSSPLNALMSNDASAAAEPPLQGLGSMSAATKLKKTRKSVARVNFLINETTFSQEDTCSAQGVSQDEEGQAIPKTPRSTRRKSVKQLAENETVESSRPLRKTPARTTRRSTSVSDMDDTENQAVHAGTPGVPTRQSRRRLMSDEDGPSSTPLKPRNVVEKVMELDTGKKPAQKTPRVKRTSASSTPAAPDEPMTMDELITPVKARGTAAKGRATKALVDTPRSGVMTRRMAQFLEGHE